MDAACSFRSFAMCSSALVYFVALKISSNFFFSVAASPRGQLLSSWCTKTTFSKMALLTPIMSGTVAFMSAHLRLTDTFSPVFSSTVWITWSRSFFSSFPPLFWVSWNDLVTTHGLARTSRNRSLICALTSVTSATFGSWMNAWPARALGGSSPVVAIFRHSMTVVFPAPLRPTMRVRGLGNMIAWSLSGLKLRMPFMSILSTEHMTASRRGFQTQSRKRGVPTRGERDLRDEGGSRCGRARRPAARYGRANEARA
mmetsp:Transcript_1738/g.4492  ORF Transcript_1738/g.4492 Transcript_1738/m.4492 type:complete len:256 (-) Transcript_1738:63-830(-)